MEIEVLVIFNETDRKIIATSSLFILFESMSFCFFKYLMSLKEQFDIIEVSSNHVNVSYSLKNLISSFQSIILSKAAKESNQAKH